MPTPVDPRARARNSLLIDRANDVPLNKVLWDFLQIDIPWGDFRSHKTYCPIGIQHGDGGASPAMRIYPDTNSAFCFAQHHYLAPVKIIALSHDYTYQLAAVMILRKYDLMKPRDFDTRFREAVSLRERKQAIDPPSLVEAIHVRLQRIPEYATHQYDQSLVDAFDKALELLDTYDLTNTDAIHQWFESTTDTLTKEVARCHRTLIQTMTTEPILDSKTAETLLSSTDLP